MAEVTITAQNGELSGEHPVGGIVFSEGKASLDVDPEDPVMRARVLYFERHSEDFGVDGPDGGWNLGGGPQRPPEGGPGSGRQAWADYADAVGVDYDDDDTRDDIRDKVDEAGA